MKLALVAFADALRERGVAEPAASIIADMAIVIFPNAFERWVVAANGRNDVRRQCVCSCSP